MSDDVCQREGCGHAFDAHAIDPSTQRFTCVAGCSCGAPTCMSEADMKAWSQTGEGVQALKGLKIV